VLSNVRSEPEIVYPEAVAVLNWSVLRLDALERIGLVVAEVANMAVPLAFGTAFPNQFVPVLYSVPTFAHVKLAACVRVAKLRTTSVVTARTGKEARGQEFFRCIIGRSA
jgi:hypothetical protein